MVYIYIMLLSDKKGKCEAMIESVRFLHETKTTFYVAVDYYQDKNPIGTLYNVNKGMQDFHSLSDMLSLIDEVVDTYYHTDKRCFYDCIGQTAWNRSKECGSFDYRKQKGKTATFSISVMFAQKNSWQGVVRWLDEDKELCFRSVLELISLIDNASCCAVKEKKSI